MNKLFEWNDHNPYHSLSIHLLNTKRIFHNELSFRRFSMFVNWFDCFISHEFTCSPYPLIARIIIALALLTLVVVFIILAKSLRLSTSSKRRVADEHGFSSTYTMVTILESENGEDYDDDDDLSVYES
ncbi:unnamed protein product [Auanema sp. JU1783]|nr:unnamed protein product [Auanema sp. JU1783]